MTKPTKETTDSFIRRKINTADAFINVKLKFIEYDLPKYTYAYKNSLRDKNKADFYLTMIRNLASSKKKYYETKKRLAEFTTRITSSDDCKIYFAAVRDINSYFNKFGLNLENTQEMMAELNDSLHDLQSIEQEVSRPIHGTSAVHQEEEISDELLLQEIDDMLLDSKPISAARPPNPLVIQQLPSLQQPPLVVRQLPRMVSIQSK